MLPSQGQVSGGGPIILGQVHRCLAVLGDPMIPGSKGQM